MHCLSNNLESIPLHARLQYLEFLLLCPIETNVLLHTIHCFSFVPDALDLHKIEQNFALCAFFPLRENSLLHSLQLIIIIVFIPTLKPVKLMQYLCKLITPKGGLILDPFAGTGTTGEAAACEGFSAILIEREEEYFNYSQNRLALILDE